MLERTNQFCQITTVSNLKNWPLEIDESWFTERPGLSDNGNGTRYTGINQEHPEILP